MSWTIKKVEQQRIGVFELWCWISLLREEIKSVNPRKSTLNIHWKDWWWSWSSNILASWCEELTHWKRPWCWERLKARGEWDNRGWDGWMASLTQWTWVWASSGSWWWMGKPGMLQHMGSWRVGHNWETKVNWTELRRKGKAAHCKKGEKWPWSTVPWTWILNNEFCFLPWPGSPSARLWVSEVHWFVSLCFYTYTHTHTHTHTHTFSLSLIPFKGWKNMCTIQVWYFLSACDCCK